jgi:hypothetical protein
VPGVGRMVAVEGALSWHKASVEAHLPSGWLCAHRSGIFNDLGSGSNVDICVITKDGAEYLRNYEFLQAKTYTRQHPVTYAPGTARELPLRSACPPHGGAMLCRIMLAWPPRPPCVS